MWSYQNGKIKLDRNKISSDFRIHAEDGLYLITPRKNLWEWKDDEKWLRSVVVDEEGFVVSCSWKRFGIYNDYRVDTLGLEMRLKVG